MTWFRRGPLARVVVVLGTLALLFTYVVPPVRAFRAPAVDHRVALPALRVPAFSFPRLNPPKAVTPAARHQSAAPFSITPHKVKTRHPVPAKQRARRVRVPVITTRYVTRPQPTQARAAAKSKAKDPWSSAPVVDQTTGAVPDLSGAAVAPAAGQPATTTPTDPAATTPASTTPAETTPAATTPTETTPTETTPPVATPTATTPADPAPTDTASADAQSQETPKIATRADSGGVLRSLSSARPSNPHRAVRFLASARSTTGDPTSTTPGTPTDGTAGTGDTTDQKKTIGSGTNGSIENKDGPEKQQTVGGPTEQQQDQQDGQLKLTVDSNDNSNAGSGLPTKSNGTTTITGGVPTQQQVDLGGLAKQNDSLGDGSQLDPNSTGDEGDQNGTVPGAPKNDPTPPGDSTQTPPDPQTAPLPSMANEAPPEPPAGQASARGPPPLTQAELDAAVAQAMAEWRADLPDANFEGVTVSIGDLPDLDLGLTDGKTIKIDPTAAGWGWSGDGEHMDLATVVMHELGHTLGLEHGDGLMDPTLQAGETETPESTTVTFGHSTNADALTAAMAAESLRGAIADKITSAVLNTPLAFDLDSVNIGGAFTLITPHVSLTITSASGGVYSGTATITSTGTVAAPALTMDATIPGGPTFSASATTVSGQYVLADEAANRGTLTLTATGLKFAVSTFASLAADSVTLVSTYDGTTSETKLGATNATATVAAGGSTA
ncbi:MAG TPA: hypothetical protein VFL66_01680, partial [Gaiellaceae bacterium]|nr:hypothetical protein [Gaiellaceae bacterium]